MDYRMSAIFLADESPQSSEQQATLKPGQAGQTSDSPCFWVRMYARSCPIHDQSLECLEIYRTHTSRTLLHQVEPYKGTPSLTQTPC